MVFLCDIIFRSVLSRSIEEPEYQEHNNTQSKEFSIGHYMHIINCVKLLRQIHKIQAVEYHHKIIAKHSLLAKHIIFKLTHRNMRNCTGDRPSNPEFPCTSLTNIAFTSHESRKQKNCTEHSLTLCSDDVFLQSAHKKLNEVHLIRCTQPER